jgi:hypothetical protein
VEWPKVVDLSRALTNCHYEMLGDWYRDPWGWCDLDWAVNSQPALVYDRFARHGVLQISKIDVPKENFAMRPAVILDPIDRVVYQALVDNISVRLIGEMRSWVFGWRLQRERPSAGHYSAGDLEWGLYRLRVEQLVNEYSCALQTDIVSFFASIPVHRLSEVILTRVRNNVTTRLTEMLAAWARVPGRSGLPQRSTASSVLANLYLRPLDDTVAALSVAGATEFPRAARWMDDIWLFAQDRGSLRAGQLQIEAGMRDLELNMGTGKTNVLEGSELYQAALEIEHGSVDAGLVDEPRRLEPLEELITKLVSAPEVAPRTSIRFTTTRLREAQEWELAAKFIPVAERMPQGADHLSRLFRDSGDWQGLADWYATYCASPWGRVEWAVAQFATMFPASKAGPPQVIAKFEELVLQHRSLPLAVAAAQRLSAWKPMEARDLLRTAAKEATDPLERRALALASVNAGEERDIVRRVLNQFEENQPTLAMLEASGFRSPAVSKDYSG